MNAQRQVSSETCLFSLLQTAADPDNDYDQITFIFPESLVKALADVEAHDMTAVIETWKETSEVPYDNDQDLQDLLAALCRLSKLALEREEDLYLWNCL